jgi:hypothetical protein
VHAAEFAVALAAAAALLAALEIAKSAVRPGRREGPALS